ncbi:MAG: hypothetical protein ACRDRJ_48370, partial [Streptosporangiaceae bacterium]
RYQPMTTAPEHPPPAAGHQVNAARHLAAIAGRLAGHGLTSRLDVLGGTPVLTIGPDDAGPDDAAVAIDPDPDPARGPVPRLDCTCTWTPAPRATAEQVAATIAAVLDAVRLPGSQPPASMPSGPAAGQEDGTR